VTELVIRKLLVDLEAPFERHWHSGDAFRSAFGGALSMSFPAGEQFFIDAVRAGAAALPEPERATFAPLVQGFIGQEATHRRVHALFNAQLERHGLVNAWDGRIRARWQRFDGLDARHAVAATAATEHFTAVFADWLLRRPHLYDGTEPRLATMWLWHSSEESEHRSVAFDLYVALGGDLRWRRKWMRIVTAYFLTDLARQTLDNLRRDGTLWRWSTWRSAASFLFGRDGMARCSFAPWRRYFAADFHPSEQSDTPAREWLAGHAGAWAPVRG
jgi:predicted metal-dependent hydrolase